MLGPQESPNTVVQLLGLAVIIIAYLATRARQSH